MVDDDRRFRSFERGERLSARGASWTLLDAQRGSDCVALRLGEDGSARVRTLLSPFDRFTRIARHHSPALVPATRWFEHIKRIGAETCPAGALQAAAAAQIRLFPYQLEPALAVLRYGATRLLIADAVGLGKTIQAGLLVAELARTSASLRVLILVPAGLRGQWAHELSRFFGLSAIHADAAWLRATSLERPVDANPWALPGLYLASHDFVKRPEVLRPLEDVTWDLLVLDEAHACRLRTDRRAAAHAIAIRADRVVLLTATPHTDDPQEFGALCSIGRIDPAEPPIVMFRRSRRDVSGAPARRSVLLRVRQTPDEQRMHQLLERYTSAVWRESQARGDELARLAAVVLRKRALSSAASLAVSVRRRIALLAGQTEHAREQLRLPLGDEDPLDDEVPAAVLGAPGLAHAPRERRWLAAIAEAAQRASRDESKLRILRTLLRRIREPAIIFTEYRDTLDRLRAILAVEGRLLLVLHGGMTPAERSRVQKRFNEGGAVLLATDAAAEGLNLHTHCRVVVHHELPWSVSRLEQRAGRVDRLGQERRVHELGLVASSTAERLVLEPLVRRANIARSRGDLHGLSAILTESRVADVVVGGAGPAPDHAVVLPQQPSGATRRLPVGDEALAEAARLSAVRDAGADTSSPRVRSTRALVTAIRPAGTQLSPGIVLVYVISLASAAGRDVHIEPLVLHLDVDGRLSSERASGRTLRTIARPFADAAHPAVWMEISRAVSGALDVAAPVHQRVAGELRRRRAAAERTRASAARQLVQAGLFDRRSTSPLAHAALTLAPDTGTALDVAASTSVLAVDVALAAVLFVARR